MCDNSQLNVGKLKHHKTTSTVNMLSTTELQEKLDQTGFLVIGSKTMFRWFPEVFYLCMLIKNLIGRQVGERGGAEALRQAVR